MNIRFPGGDNHFNINNNFNTSRSEGQSKPPSAGMQQLAQMAEIEGKNHGVAGMGQDVPVDAKGVLQKLENLPTIPEGRTAVTQLRQEALARGADLTSNNPDVQNAINEAKSEFTTNKALGDGLLDVGLQPDPFIKGKLSTFKENPEGPDIPFRPGGDER